MNEEQIERIRRVKEDFGHLPMISVIEAAFRAGMTYRVPRGSNAGMTTRQRELLNFIETYTEDHGGVCPSYEEMAQALGLKAKSGVHRLVVALEERGKILRLPDHARAIEVIRTEQAAA